MTRGKNHLAKETSPYLLQHASNPVDWYPWGDEAFEKAMAENKPIFLSVGYSACHWCHVMERESFENDSIASIMNQFFVNIKVDREERPDLDDIYMTFVQTSTGGGGWPLSVFLTPDRKPFFGGTYFPPVDAYGRRGFPHILRAVAEAWQNDREKVLASGNGAIEYLNVALQRADQPGSLQQAVIDSACNAMLERFDPVEGGFGGAPKFPPSYSLSLLMRQYSRTKSPQILKAVALTLEKMAAGGIYDQLGGGFHRYAVDSAWVVPHFEKMLYDNALLSVTYLEAFQLTAKPLFKQVACDILDYVLRDMRDRDGGFHSAEDADSEGEEGKFYVWTPEEVIAELGTDDGKLFCDFYDVTNAGNFEGHKSILHLRVPSEIFAERYHLSVSDLDMKLISLRQKLLAVRNKRVRPHIDDKVLAEWNGLMLSALSHAFEVTQEKRYLDGALSCANFVESKMFDRTLLQRVYRSGKVKQPGFVTDYAFVANGMIDLYESSFDLKWLNLADSITSLMVEKFYDRDSGGFYLAEAGQKDLLVRQKDSYDGAIPSGSSVACMALLRLSRLFDQREYSEIVEKTFSSLALNATKMPLAYMNLLNAYDFYQYQPKEIALVGDPSGSDMKELIKALHAQYIPNKIIALINPAGTTSASVSAAIPFLQHRTIVDGKSTAYVCKNFVCRLPVNSVDGLLSQLKE